MDAEKLTKFTIAKVNDESDLFLLDEIENTQQKIEEVKQAFSEGLSQLTEEVKKKEAEEMRFEIDLEEIKGEKGDKGDSIIGPQGPMGPPGRDVRGIDGTDGVDGVSITGTKMENENLIIEFSDGKKINVGKIKGEKGDKGELPEHEWSGTYLRWKKADGTWGDWTNLQGPEGRNAGVFFGGALGSAISVKNAGTQVINSVQSLNFTGDVTVTKSGETVSVDYTSGVPESLAIAYAVAL